VNCSEFLNDWDESNELQWFSKWTVSKVTMSFRANWRWVPGWTGVSSYKNRMESWTELSSSLTWTERNTRTVWERSCSPFYRNVTRSLPGYIINKRPGYSAATLGCRSCVDCYLSSLRGMPIGIICTFIALISNAPYLRKDIK